MKKTTIGAIIWMIVLLGVMVAGKFYYRNLRGSTPAFAPPVGNIVDELSPAKNSTRIPLSFPQGFSVSIYAKNVNNARVLLFDSEGTLLVSEPSQGKVVALIDRDKNGEAEQMTTVIEGLNLPHGITFYNGKLYIAETDKVSAFEYNPSSHAASNGKKLFDLPGGGNHFSRTIGFGPDKKLYVSIGSTCNVCKEKDARRASILVANPDGSDLKTYAQGLRNAVFFIWNSIDSRMWATNMGRDLIGDDIPPDTINIVTQGKNFGWPYCYGKNVWDKTFDSSQKASDFCKTVEPSYVDLPAHSAPLGLAFIPKSWGVEYSGDLLVAYHGSWNRSIPTGYKIVRLKLDSKGGYESTEDFMSGWLTGAKNASGALGRPVDLRFATDGALYVSDDKAGVIYKVMPVKK